MIDELKTWGVIPEYSGLGFIFLHEPNKKVRWNFYCPDLTPVEVPDFHNHRIKFESQIIRGGLINEVVQWKPAKDSPLQIVETNCVNPHHRRDVIEDSISIFHDGEYYLPAGAWYTSEAYTFHRVKVLEQSITKLHIIENKTKNNLTIRDKNKPFRCPLKDFQKPEKECWEIIRTFF